MRSFCVSLQRFFCLLACICRFCTMKSQELDTHKIYYLSAIGFWNVENLYDTLNDAWKNDEDFTPQGLNAWTGDRYRTKISHLAFVIEQMARDVSPDGLAVLGLCEVENKTVLNDLVQEPRLKDRHYRYIHVDGPDTRGVDPALLYNPAYFKVAQVITRRIRLPVDSTHRTRDILLVLGSFCEEPVCILVNHWPSRRGGEINSRPNRMAAAAAVRHLLDSLRHKEPGRKIIIMGDLNDDPLSRSVKNTLGTYATPKRANDSLYFNPMENLYKKGIGTLAYQDSWNLFDQILLSSSWTNDHYSTWTYYKARVYNAFYLKSDFGNFRGYPLRTYSGAVYTGGYSDHFPVYLVLMKEKN